MKHIMIVLILLTAAVSYAVEARLVFNPDVSKDNIVFTFEQDLWVVPIGGGTAHRITNHPGLESPAKFSPDGKMIAFTGEYDGGTDIYIIPVEGGEPQRLTYHPSADIVTGWSKDGNYVYFVSRRELYFKLYRVATKGGYPEVFPIRKVWQASVSPDGSTIAYVPTNDNTRNWKGYKGGRQQDIFLYNETDKSYTKLIAWEGYDNFPMLTAQSIYFNSDREDGRMNLYRYDRTTAKINRLTSFKDWDVESPSYGEGKIVYVNNGYLWIYDTQLNSNQKLAVTIPSERWQTRDFFINPEEFIHDGAPSADGKKAVVEARGDIYIIDTENEKAQNITQTSDVRELCPVFSPDEKSIAFYSDKSGEYELYVMTPATGESPVQITKDSKTYYYAPIWSPDSSKIAFEDKDFNVYIATIKTKEVLKIDRFPYLKDNELFWEWSDYSWSPDSRYLAYSVVTENLNNSLRLYDTIDKKIIPLTDGYFDDYSPSFDENGLLLYFLSNRNFQPQLDPFMDNSNNVETTVVNAFLLQNKGPKPFTKEFINNLPEEKTKEIKIDFDQLDQRVFRVPIEPGTYKRLQAKLNTFYLMSKKDFGFPNIREFFNPRSVRDYSLKNYDLASAKTKEITAEIAYYQLSADGKNALYVSASELGLIELKENTEKKRLSFYGLKHAVYTGKEFVQIFRDVWRQMRDFFYDPDMHGKDWNWVYDKYSELVPFVSSRADINYLIGQAIGEVYASHEYIINRGGPERLTYDETSVGLLGAELEPDFKAGYYKFKKIFQGRSDVNALQSPLMAPGIKVKMGDYLLKIDGQTITAEDNYLKYLQAKAGQEVTLTVNDKPVPQGAKEYKVTTLSLEFLIRYIDFVYHNTRKVDARTKNRVGYMHLIDMDENGLSQFEEAFRALRYKDGLIIDVRFNGGGFVSWFIIDKLERELLYLTQTRDLKPMRYPHGTHHGPIVLICDEDTGSDGEVFTQHFKDIKRGTVIGTRTWGGLIGIINILPLLDGGSITQANVGFANLNGNWIVENHGVEPDIEVLQDPAKVANGEDPQLDFAIDFILKELQKSPPKEITAPPFPKK